MALSHRASPVVFFRAYCKAHLARSKIHDQIRSWVNSGIDGENHQPEHSGIHNEYLLAGQSQEQTNMAKRQEEL